jgi:uncharacterized membrane protein YuzA (DUF378 family)
MYIYFKTFYDLLTLLFFFFKTFYDLLTFVILLKDFARSSDIYNFFFAPLFNSTPTFPIPVFPLLNSTPPFPIPVFNDTQEGPKKHLPLPPFYNTTGSTGTDDTNSVSGSGDTSSGSDSHSSSDTDDWLARNTTMIGHTESVGAGVLNASVILLITFPLVGLAAYYAAALSKKVMEAKQESNENVESHRMMSSSDIESPPVEPEEKDEEHSNKGIRNPLSRTAGYSPTGSEDVLFEHPSMSI